MVSGTGEEEVAAIVARIGALFERAHLPTAAQPTAAEVEEVLTDGYACVLALEAGRARIERRSAELFASGRATRTAARELRAMNARAFEQEREIARLRSLLAELREYAGSAALLIV